MRILGIDPGLRVTGFGVIDCGGGQARYVTSGVIRTVDTDLPARLRTIFEGVQRVAAEADAQVAAVEQVFVNVNPRSTLMLGQARGAAIAALVAAGLPVSEYTALQVKQAVAGHGRAAKPQIQAMVARLLSLAAEPSPDAADALACALCHAHGGALVGALLGQTRTPLGATKRRGVRIRRGRLVQS
ncbi:MAG: crossover junction endodeoxyribonuclease RuvC [Burkholderiales bacterium]|nr:MAG: crossover junction endodeoxyribonuclease RuvC [Burkholderiales bacterium]